VQSHKVRTSFGESSTWACFFVPWGMGLRLAFVALALGALVFADRANAACQLRPIAELPINTVGLRLMTRAKINGVEAPFIVDSGSFTSMLTPGAAAQFHLPVAPVTFGFTVRGLGGQSMSMGQTTVGTFTLSGHDYHNLHFLVGEKGWGGEAVGLLGQNVLGGSDVEYDLPEGVIRIFKAEGCGRDDNLAYWTASQPYSEIDLEFTDEHQHSAKSKATLNGVPVRVEFDTGSPRSILSLSAANKAGVKPGDPGVAEAGYMTGITAGSFRRNWLAPFANFKLGDEQVTNFKLMMGDYGLGGDADMLIGADFFISHRVLISYSQHKLYFTYTGGPVFDMKLPPKTDAVTATAAEPTGAEPTGAAAPIDADGYMRAAADARARRDFTAAIDDLTKAMALAPNDPRYAYDRGVTYAIMSRPLLAMADLNAALKLKPDMIAALVTRSRVHAALGQKAEARDDLDAADRAAAGRPDERLLIGQVYARQGYDKKAIAEFDQWIPGHPKDDHLADALNDRCWSRALLGVDLDKALTDCNAAVKLSSGSPVMFTSRGLVRYRMGDLDGAIADYDASLKVTNAAWPLYGRGLARLKKGLTTDGQADLRQASVLAPHMAEDAASHGLTP